MMWNLDSAIKLIKETQETAKTFGYHICLGGGVLNKRESNKDLDIYFLPLIGIQENYEGLLRSLEIGWGIPEEFGYGKYNEPTPYRISLRYFGSKNSDAFKGKLEVFIV